MKDQVLKVLQVRELQKLGFDVDKHSSIMYETCNNCNCDECIDREELSLCINKNRCCVNSTSINTMTVNDIIEVLPEAIFDINSIYYYLSITKKIVSYKPLNNIQDILFFSEEKRRIDALYETLIWCIENKYIEL